MADASLIKEATVDVFEETGRCLLPKIILIIITSIKMNITPTPSEDLYDWLDFGTQRD